MRSNKWTIYCYKSISWQYIIKIFNDWYSFLRFRDLLKSNFWSRRKPKYFWETLRSTGTWLKKTWGWNRVTVFREKITSWACLVRSWLNIIFHWYAHSEILFKSVSISSVETCHLQLKTFIYQTFMLNPIKSFLHIQIFETRFQRWEVIKRIINFVHYRQKLIYTWISFPESWLIGTEKTVSLNKFIEQIKI